jgi:hypothetical protein
MAYREDAMSEPSETIDAFEEKESGDAFDPEEGGREPRIDPAPEP